MRKDRNAFFNETQATNYTYFPQPQMPVMTGQMSSNYYNGPYPLANNVNNNDSSELEARINKMERQINRLDTRVSKLEQDFNPINYGTKDTGNNTGMYII